MSSSDLAATTGAATDPHPVLGYSGPGPRGQLGNVGQVYPFLSHLPATPGAGLQGHGYVHWRFGDFFRTWCLAEGEGTLPRLAAGALGVAHPSTFGEGSSLAFGAALQLSDFTAQGLVAGGQLSHLTLQLGYQSQQLLSAQGFHVFKGI